MAGRRSTRKAPPATSKVITVSRSAKPAANKKAIKKAKKEPSPELGDFDDGDSDDQDQSIIYELKTKNDRMVRKIQCTMDNGNVAVLDKKKTYNQTVALTSKKPFSLEPVLMNEGPYQGRYVLVLQPEPADNEKFPFLELPAEIRNMIYSYVLERPGWNLHISGKQSGVIEPRWRKKSGEWITPAMDSYSTSLMRVNKQISAESTPYLFSRHMFEFPDTTMMQRFLDYIGPKRVESLVSVRVDTQYHTSAKKAYKLLAPATSLTKVELSAFRFRRYYRAYTPDWHLYLLPLIQGMCLAGRSREDAIGSISIVGNIEGHCLVHGHFYGELIEKCDKAKTAFEEFYKKLRDKMGTALDAAEAKKKAIKKGTPAKTRAGRKTKTVDYADDDSDSDYKG
ncbi:hypothetical protein D6C86_06339 [Aureobasidium pullulans]|uniref:DUF7730 domain-containing protein n=1 Tax=Aureobasidium pullulans TaxID=5580 RepID=A0A4V4KUN1_AURPU|nr:hypothetical protein D6C94_07112 [Aureobasidium pullulans]THZ41608.1 hypothetical protein D6C87_05602 [Aureobasidium pullulans]THZ58521.1 hypothetical protein D6C86_06339 [Aureobasidium pullulans]